MVGCHEIQVYRSILRCLLRFSILKFPNNVWSKLLLMHKIITSILFWVSSLTFGIALHAQSYYPYSEPGAPLQGNVLAKFIEDSTKYHNTRAVYEGPPYKSCLPHACVNRMGKYALVGYDHRPVTQFEFDRLYGHWSSHLFIARNKQMAGCMDTTGKLIVPMIYPDLYINEWSLIFTSRDANTAQVFNHQGQQILPVGYQYVGPVTIGSQHLLKARNAKQDSLIFFDHNGKIVKAIKGVEMNELAGSNGNRYSVKTIADFYSGTMIVDSNFQEVLTLDFYKIGWANDEWISGSSTKSRNPMMYHIPEKKYYPLDFDDVTPLKGSSYAAFMAHDYSTGRQGILDKKLQTIVPTVYSSLQHIGGGNIFIAGTANNQFGLIDGYGKILLDTSFIFIREIVSIVPVGDKGNVTPEFTGLVTVRNESEELVYNIEKKAFIKGEVIAVSPDVYWWKSPTAPARLMRKDGTAITEVFAYWTTKSLMSIVQKDRQAEVVQVYDRSGKLIKTLEGTPINDLSAGDKNRYSWRFKNGKVGIYNGDLKQLVEPKYDHIYSLEEMPKEHICALYRYTYRHKHDLIAWVWDNTQTIPLLIKENGSTVRLDELK